MKEITDQTLRDICVALMTFAADTAASTGHPRYIIESGMMVAVPVVLAIANDLDADAENALGRRLFAIWRAEVDALMAKPTHGNN